MPVEPLNIFCYFDRQRFTAVGPMDCANWYGVASKNAKKQQALYPAMGRKHVEFLGQNKLIFDTPPRNIFRSIDYFYVVVGTRVFQYDRFFNEKFIGTVSLTGDLWFDFLPVGTTVYCMLTDGSDIYVITESGTTVTMEVVTDPRAPANPAYVAAFGNRFTVSSKDTPDYSLSTINLDGTPATYFTFGPMGLEYPLTNRASGIIRQMGVLHNQLYIFTDFTTDIWANIPTQIEIAGVVREFPWKLNTSYNWDFGIADSYSLSIGFGMMAWLAKNRDGLVSFMSSNGQQPQPISTQAVNVLLQNPSEDESLSPFIVSRSDGFLYQYEDSIFYRVSAAQFADIDDNDVDEADNCLEYSFDTQTWHRCIELNGSKNRIQKHIFFNSKHLVTVEDDTAIYQMAGNIYYNELRNESESGLSPNAFSKYPMRYELVTSQIFMEKDYAEFITDYVEIDFVFGNKTFYKSNAPFLNTVYLTDESSTPESPVYLVTEDDKFIIQEGTNTPTFDDNHYNALFKPHIELYYSDDGGITFTSADVREFSPLGFYRWRMRWYQLGPSRNRCYKLVCVSSAPIVILGGVQNIRRSSGGAN